MTSTATVSDPNPLATTARRCRSCGAELQNTFIDLGMSPLANSNIDPARMDRMEPFYPLHAYVCHECFLVQLEEFETPEAIFSDYVYLSSYSESWVEHARRYVEMVTARFDLNERSQVVEIASNDGYLLQHFIKRKIKALGIEPAANVARIAQGKGIPTHVAFFGEATARALSANGTRADLIVANNVLAHVPGLNDFIEGLSIMLKPGGVVTCEFPHLLRLMEESQFDTIYHEHFSYFSLLSVSKAFARHRLAVIDVEELPTHGGSLRIYVAHADDRSLTVGPRVADLLRREREKGLATLEPYKAFAGKAAATKRKLLRFLIEAKSQGKTIVGYGAPAKGNTLLNYCGIRSDFIDYVVDLNPLKQGRYLPGTRIPIFSPEKIRETQPDYVLLLPWNLRGEIMGQMAYIRDWGGRFVTPLPEVAVHS
jgi:SAM-dependent methyltransferase